MQLFNYWTMLETVGARIARPSPWIKSSKCTWLGMTAYFSRCTVGYLSEICKIACSTAFPIAESSGQGDGRALRAPTAWEFCRNRVGSFQNKCTLPCVQKVMKYAPFWL